MARPWTDAEYQAILKRRAVNELRRITSAPPHRFDPSPRTNGGGAVELLIPGEPFAWKRTTGKGKQRYTEPEMRAHQNMVKSIAVIGGIIAPLTGPIRLEIFCYRSVPPSWSIKETERAWEGKRLPTSVPDASNYLKEVEDALNAVAWLDDAQICQTYCEKWYVRREDKPHTRVRITPL